MLNVHAVGAMTLCLKRSSKYDYLSSKYESKYDYFCQISYKLDKLNTSKMDKLKVN